MPQRTCCLNNVHIAKFCIQNKTNMAACATAIEHGLSYLLLLTTAAFQLQLPAIAGSRVSLLGFAAIVTAMGMSRQGAERRTV